MTTIQTAHVVRYSVEVIKYRFWFILETDHVITHIKAADREIYLFVDLLLASDLCHDHAEHPRILTLAFSGSEPTELNHHDWREVVDLQLLRDVPMLFAFATVELVVSG